MQGQQPEQRKAHGRRLTSALAAGLFALTGLNGCAVLEPQPSAQTPSPAEVQALRDQLDATHQAMLEVSSLQASDTERMAARLQVLTENVQLLPEQVAAACRTRTPSAPVDCSDVADAPRRIAVRDDKMVVGELERVWIDPPGVALVARVDTGAQSNSLHAENLVEFERDGERWVRFEVEVGADAPVTVERRVERYVRVVQASDAEGSRRPVVNIQLRIADVQDSFEFTLADRGHLEFELLLGRNFLTDIAIVDVAQQFVQSSADGSQPNPEEASE